DSCPRFEWRSIGRYSTIQSRSTTSTMDPPRDNVEERVATPAIEMDELNLNDGDEDMETDETALLAGAHYEPGAPTLQQEVFVYNREELETKILDLDEELTSVKIALENMKMSKREADQKISLLEGEAAEKAKKARYELRKKKGL
ncbi:hypothetical protein PFISCL1PPCAC_22671, partial [Pristionchus fissidentatus]